eukprot:TRINITY_DN8134_c0_g1_i1.p1 TRINITY_DN8134_c0_g1~~TRINITY_DN8134_c0_g1_i1.p1  ORF type:complete len:243 (+),score=42.51 TRINITY_DN8134_c0_g1_i1:54-782(+)
MYQSKSEYDRGVNTFSPEGRIFQIEYAIEAIKLGSTAVGIQTFEGVVLAAEKRISSILLDPESVNKIVEIDSHIGCVMSGLTADARTLIEHARVETQNHRFTFNEPMRVETCTLSVCDLSLGFGEGGRKQRKMSRPFGVSLLIGGVDADGPALWHTDPSGTYVKYEAKSIGAGSEGAQTILQEQYHKSMNLEEATQLCVSILKQTMEEKLNASNVEVAVIPAASKKLKVLSTTEIEALIQKL